MNDAERRNIWADRIERCLASSTTIKQWCQLNHVCPSSLYKWMARFHEEEPGRFPQRSSVAKNWMEVTRGGIADSKALVPATVHQSPELMPEHAQAYPDNTKSRWSADHGFCGQNTELSASGSIRVFMGRIELAIPPGSAECDIASVMRVASGL